MPRHAHSNANRGKNGSRRAAFHPTKQEQRNALHEANAERFVHPTPTTSTCTRVAGAKRPPCTPTWHRHPNFAATEGATVPAMRALHLRLTNAEPPPQIGKAKLREALCQPHVPALSRAVL